jgi:parallel beta-helix repeat protein
MNRVFLTFFTSFCLLSAVFLIGLSFNVQPVKASGTIYIRADGSIDPPTALTSTVDNVTYALTGDITSDFDGIVIERDSITLDGAGHTLQGNGSGTGVDLSLRNNVTIENMQIREFYDGIILDNSSGDSISGNNITANNNDGIHVSGPSLVGTSNTISRDNITENDRFGIYLADCNSNNVSENSIIANHVDGVYLDYSDDNIFTGNMIGNNGLSLWSSSGNVLRSNNITDNAKALSVNGIGHSDFVNDVDVSNTVNGKPIYYMVHEHDRSIPIDAGYVALVLCSGITVQNLNLTNNGQGILLVNTTDSIITQNNITNNDGDISLLSSCSNSISVNRITNSGYGIKLDSSKGNSIFGNIITTSDGLGVVLEASSNSNNVSGNNITNNVRGICLEQCGSNIISWNNITASKADGIYLWSCFNDIIFANEIANNNYGINIDYGLLDAASSSGNKLYHNNLVNNTNQVTSFYYSTSIWDDGYPSGGNYWSDYNGTDLYSGANQNLVGSDGIGDTVYTIATNNYDRYPLTAPTHAYISVPYYRQLKSYYCGPAALQMVFDFYGPVIPQSEIADAARTASDGTYTPDMVRASHFSNLSTSVGREMPTNITGYTARKLGYAAFEYGGMAIHQLKSLVARGYPIIVLITWHFIVAVGYDSFHITFQDSLNGPKYNMTYQDFDMEWDYSGHWALVVSPWKIDVLLPQNVEQSNVFNVTASITYPLPPPFYPGQYNAANASAAIALPPGLTLVSGENARKSIDTGVLTAGTSVNITWTVRGGSVGVHMVFVEAEGIVAGLVPGLPSYPEPYNYEDRIGGQGQGVITVNPGPDGTPPTTLDDCNGLWHTTDFTVTLNASDDASGVADTYYKINDGPTKTVSADGQPFITTEGTYNKLEYWSVDNAGNEELPHKILTEIKLDKTAPIGSITINNGTTYTTSTSVTLTLTATDSTSGVYQVRFSNDGVWDTEPWQTPSTTKTWTLTSGDGAKTVYYQVKDNAGLSSETYSNTITLDETAPAIEIPTREPASDVQPDQSVKASVNVTDATSHVKNTTLYYSLNNGTTWEEPILMNLNGITNLYEATIPGQPAGTWVKYKIVAYDYAGNNATLDRTEPYCVYQVIPEFPTFLVFPIFMIMTLLAVIVYRRKQADKR